MRSALERSRDRGVAGPSKASPRLRHRAFLASLALVALIPALSGCGSEAAGPADDEPEPGASRTYAMGWTPNPPRPSDELFLAAVDSAARVSDVTIVQQPVPWARLLDRRRRPRPAGSGPPGGGIRKARPGG